MRRQDTRRVPVPCTGHDERPVPHARRKEHGPRTAKGLKACRLAGWKHGFCAKEAVERRRSLQRVLRQWNEVLDALGRG